jgi:serine/threonine-protein kinase
MTGRERWLRIEAIVDAVLEERSEERPRLARALCADAPDLLPDVLAFLADIDTSASFLAQPASEQAAALVDEATAGWDPEARLGQRLGAWELVEILGQGGMGVVYGARRADGQYEAEAAVKLILGLDPRSGLRDRLFAERQILADLNDPRIARLFDGGVDDDGHPYLVMERIDGRTIVDHCEQEGLGLDDRLALFVEVCRTVHAAHQRMILHCDLKPSNILVTRSGELKLLDFGVARPLDRESAATRDDDPAVRMLTPGYASPEQRRQDPLTPASDVFALGVLLYELLCGVRPELDDGGARRNDVAPSRLAQGRSWRRRLRGDLDAVVTRALAQRPEDRYATAEALADELARWQQHRPVSAVRASWPYRARRALRRHWLASGAGAVILIAVLAGLSATIWQARVAAHERDQARQETLRAQAVSDFMIDLFYQADPSVSVGADLTAREIVARGRETIAELAGQPELQAALASALATVHYTLGMYAEAASLYRDELAAEIVIAGEESDRVSDTRIDLAQTLVELGEFATARHEIERCLAYRRAHPREHDPRWLSVPMRALARVAGEEQDTIEATRLYEQALAMFDPDDPQATEDLGRGYTNLAGCYRDLGQLARADSTYARARDYLEQSLPAHHALFGKLDSNWALVVAQMGDLQRAESLHRRALAIKRTLQHNRVDIGVSLINLGNLLVDTGRSAEALPLLEEAVTIQREAFGEDHLYVAAAEINVGSALVEAGDHQAATARFRRGESIMRRVYGDDNVLVARAMAARASAVRASGDLDGAARLLREAVTMHRRHLPTSPVNFGEALLELAEVEDERGEPERARDAAREAAEILTETVGADHADTQRARELAAPGG